MRDDDKLLNKIKRLFALAESSNENEALLAYKKAHELLREHNLSVQDVMMFKGKGEVHGHTVHGGKRESRWRSMLLSSIATSNYCRLITSRIRYTSFEWIVYGRESNVATTVLMYEYLEEVVCRVSGKEKNAAGWIDANSFRIGIVYKIAKRLHAMREQELSNCTALVPVVKEVDEAILSELGKVATKQINVKNNNSYLLGYLAGDDVSLNRQMTGATL